MSRKSDRKKAPPHYHLPKGTKVKVRRCGTTEWEPFTTTRKLNFASYSTDEGRGAFWLFVADGWELRVAPSVVRVTGADGPMMLKKPRPPVGKGKGRSRRATPDSSLLAAHRREVANGPPFSGVGEVSAPGCGVDEWREKP